MGVKFFKNLASEIIETDLCNICGACLAVCTANDVNKIHIKNNRPQYIGSSEGEKQCLECGVCYLICGQISNLDVEIEDLYSVTPPLGKYKYLTCAKTVNPRIQEVAQDGGIVTSILKYLFEKNLIDGAVVNKPTEKWDSEPYIITSSEELVQSAGTRYSAIPAVEALGTYKILNKDNPRLAFVGTPCQIKTIRKMQLLKVRPGIFVKYAIGLFCMENFDYQKLMKEKLEDELKLDLNNVKKLTIKGKLIITLENDEQIEIPLKELNDLVRNNCHFCQDFANYYADISVGGIGAPQGYSTVLVRTKIGDTIFYHMKLENQIEELSKEKFNVSQVMGKILSQISKLGEIKYDRGKKKKLSLES